MIDALRVRGIVVAALTDANPSLVNTAIDGIRVVGGDSVWPQLLGDGFTHAFIGVGSVGDAAPRRDLFEKLIANGFEIIQVIHPSAIVSSKATLGRGAIVLAGAVINSGAVIGENVIVNTAAVVEHDCTIGDHAHIASGACLASTVRVGAEAHIGAGATIRQGISIGEAAIVGAGAVVIADVPPRVTVVGVPARPLVRARIEVPTSEP
jgi:UDP-perosamine 4-acetyltransferase